MVPPLSIIRLVGILLFIEWKSAYLQIFRWKTFICHIDSEHWPKAWRRRSTIGCLLHVSATPGDYLRQVSCCLPCAATGDGKRQIVAISTMSCDQSKWRPPIIENDMGNPAGNHCDVWYFIARSLANDSRYLLLVVAGCLRLPQTGDFCATNERFPGDERFFVAQNQTCLIFCNKLQPLCDNMKLRLCVGADERFFRATSVRQACDMQQATDCRPSAPGLTSTNRISV